MEKYTISRLSALGAVVFMLCTSNVFAQVPHLNIGFELGTYSSNTSAHATNNTGTSFSGVSADIFGRVTKGRILFQSGVTYRLLYRVKNGTAQWQRISSDYLGTPFETGLDIVKGRYLKWRIITALTPMVRVSGVDAPIGNMGENLNRWLLPAGIGTGLDIGYLSLSFRYNYLLNNFFESATRSRFTAMNIRAGIVF